MRERKEVFVLFYEVNIANKRNSYTKFFFKKTRKERKQMLFHYKSFHEHTFTQYVFFAFFIIFVTGKYDITIWSP